MDGWRREDDKKEMVILGRKVRWTKNGIEYEADGKHRSELLNYFGLNEKSRGLKSNGDKEDKAQEGDEEPLTPEEVTTYRGLAARLNF